MSGFLESEVEEYLTSQYFLFLDPPLKEHALSILTAFAQGCTRAGALAAPAMSIEILNAALTEFVARLPIDAASRKRAPLLIKAFFEYLDTSGRIPGASVWAGWTARLAEEFVSRIRENGTIRGETYTQRAASVNRNDPCPCGSGKKFKKCCMGLLG